MIGSELQRGKPEEALIHFQHNFFFICRLSKDAIIVLLSINETGEVEPHGAPSHMSHAADPI